MDSLTQIVLGAACAAAVAPPGRRRAALLVGAALGTLPDLDVLVRYADPVDDFTRHRSWSHSLFVLPPLALLLWALARQFVPAVRESPGRWFAAIALALVTHPLLDAFTVYGTQLWWPLDRPPVMGATIFIIDPLYTLPLLVAVIAAWRLRERPRAGAWLLFGLATSQAYLGWTVIAKWHLERSVRALYAAEGLPDPKLLTVPTPFNSLLWRVVVMQPEHYGEGYYSFLDPTGRLEIVWYPSQPELLVPLADSPAVARLDWFTHGFRAAHDARGRIVYTDLRMGAEPDYVFRFAVGRRAGDEVVALEPTEQAPFPFDRVAQLATVWQRLRGAPDTAVAR